MPEKEACLELGLHKYVRCPIYPVLHARNRLPSSLLAPPSFEPQNAMAHNSYPNQCSKLMGTLMLRRAIWVINMKLPSPNIEET